MGCPIKAPKNVQLTFTLTAKYPKITITKISSHLKIAPHSFLSQCHLLACFHCLFIHMPFSLYIYSLPHKETRPHEPFLSSFLSLPLCSTHANRMARKKVKLAWISNESSRKATYKKRKKGLLKKVKELSTLCGVPACAIICGPQTSQPLEMWPTVAEAREIIVKFKRLPEMEQSKKMMNQEGFLRQRLAKLKEQLKRQQRENREAEATVLMYQSLAGKGLHGATLEDLHELSWLVGSKMKVVEEKIEVLKRAATAPAKIQAREGVTHVKNEIRGGEKAMPFHDHVVAMEMEALQRQQWFMEVMNSHDPMGYAGGGMVGHFGDSNPWLDACFP